MQKYGVREGLPLIDKIKEDRKGYYLCYAEKDEIYLCYGTQEQYNLELHNNKAEAKEYKIKPTKYSKWFWTIEVPEFQLLLGQYISRTLVQNHTQFIGKDIRVIFSMSDELKKE